MKRAEILQKAKECVCGQREQDYGTPEDNFRKIADLWNAYLGDKYVDATDVAMMMALLKIARIKSGTATEDSFVDLAGYAACGGEIKTASKGPYADIAEKCKLVYQAPFDWNKPDVITTCSDSIPYEEHNKEHIAMTEKELNKVYEENGSILVGDIRRICGYPFPGRSDDEIFMDGSMEESEDK